MITLSNRVILTDIIGSRIELLGSTGFHVGDGYLVINEMNLLICSDKNNILLKCDLKDGFFENEDGEVFYDYFIEEATNNSPSRRSTVLLHNSEILKIDIFGRIIREDDFLSYPNVYQKIKGETVTDDFYYFRCEDGDDFAILFHPFMPGIEVYLKKEKVEEFWNQYGKKYHLNQTITNETNWNNATNIK